MNEQERMGIIIAVTVIIVILTICGTIVIATKINNDRLGPSQKRQYEKQIEAVRACEKSADINSCIRLALGEP